MKKRNFGGEKLSTPIGFKLRKGMRDAIKSVALHYEISETEVVEDLLDQGLKQIIEKENIKIQSFDYGQKKESKPTS